MRVPFYLWFPLVCGVVGVTWWLRTREMDFLTPPGEVDLAALRQSVEVRIGKLGVTQDAVSVPVEAPPSAVDVPPVRPPVVEEPVVAGAPDERPGLDAYLDEAAAGAEGVIELATALEQREEFQRALLAWERVLDHGQPDAAQAEAAMAAIRRLKPTMPLREADPENALAITVQAGTGAAMAAELEPVLKAIAADLEVASGGVLRVTAEVAQGGGEPLVGRPSPVAVWLAGPAGGEPSTAVVSFTASPGDALRAQVLRLIGQLVADELRLKSGWSRAAAPVEGEDPEAWVKFGITRLGWQTLGRGLQPPAGE